MDCPAKVIMKDVTHLPQYKVGIVGATSPQMDGVFIVFSYKGRVDKIDGFL